MDDEFKEIYYETVKYFQRDGSAYHNPFYLRKFKKLQDTLQKKLQQHNATVPKITPIKFSHNEFDIFESALTKQRQPLQNLGRH